MAKGGGGDGTAHIDESWGVGTLRTVPNILVTNLALVDIINALTNMPLFISWYICQTRSLSGPFLSWFVVMFYVLFMYLTVASLVVLMLDRYGAIVHGLRYHTWKTRNKAYVSVAVIWLAATAYAVGMFSLGVHIDIGDKPVWMYRILYFKKFGRSFLIPGYLVPFAVIIILGYLIWREVRKSTLLRVCPRSSLGKHARTDIKTAKTIGITILTYFWMGCFPVLLHSVARIHGSWLHFLAFFFIYTNSMANPVIFSLRAQRFRKAFVLLFREPFGHSQPIETRHTTLSGVTNWSSVNQAMI
ncbi:predicted protein [Nematostella vectensis]|uniref:G-protein coupled receptors family 1 profile domain-containing protein n=1 Tax=Nematostella vectensis TaxID=45351 RepID=A7RMS2_NEMVE|nr:predicted protein [Nematostella vectensis]|eukprot:XP_001639208.1 predicted protein [Nematostella vectensis]